MTNTARRAIRESVLGETTVTVETAGYCAGYGDAPQDASFARAICGGEMLHRRFALADLIALASRNAAYGTKWWVKLADGRVVSGFSDGSGVTVDGAPAAALTTKTQ